MRAGDALSSSGRGGDATMQSGTSFNSSGSNCRGFKG
jgi:hypothetical protein